MSLRAKLTQLRVKVAILKAALPTSSQEVPV
jgi:hypothetical protein